MRPLRRRRRDKMRPSVQAKASQMETWQSYIGKAIEVSDNNPLTGLKDNMLCGESSMLLREE